MRADVAHHCRGPELLPVPSANPVVDKGLHRQMNTEPCESPVFRNNAVGVRFQAVPG